MMRMSDGATELPRSKGKLIGDAFSASENESITSISTIV